MPESKIALYLYNVTNTYRKN